MYFVVCILHICFNIRVQEFMPVRVSIFAGLCQIGTCSPKYMLVIHHLCSQFQFHCLKKDINKRTLIN